RSFHDHFGCELHTGGAQSERENSLPVEATQAAMEVGYGGAEEQPADEGKNRVTKITVQRRHRAGTDTALETIAHDQRESVPQLFDEPRQPAEIVAVVGVAHDDVFSVRRRDSGAQRRTIAALRRMDHPR